MAETQEWVGYNPIHVAYSKQIGTDRVELVIDPVAVANFYVRVTSQHGYQVEYVWDPDSQEMAFETGTRAEVSRRAINYALALGMGFALGRAFEIVRD